MKSLLAFALLLAALFDGSMGANATNFLAVPLSQTIGNSPVVVAGTVGATSGQIIGGKPFTYYEIAVSEVLKGNVSGASIQVRQFGGLNLYMSGAANLATGENVVLLLNPANGDGSYDMHGLSMGKMDVLPTGELAGLPVDSDRHATEAAPTGEIRLSGVTAQPHGPWTVGDLRNLIKNGQ